jgi:orotidine-5'-phosphate decarboxylase
MNARDRLAVPLDVPSLEEARRLEEALGGVPGWLKVGSELFGAAGPEAIRMAARRSRVFLDLKFHDIPNQVARAVAIAVRNGVGMLTLHAAGGSAMLAAARDAADEAAERSDHGRPLLVAVTVLTSLDDAALKEVGLERGVSDQVARLVDLAQEVRLDGIVASAREAGAIRSRVGPEFVLVTPGIRGAQDSADDQARTATPAEAVAAGSDLLVMGRPILHAAEPAAAAAAVVAEIEAGLGAAQG